MKKITLLITILTLVTLNIFGQNAGRTLDLSDGYVTFSNTGLSSKFTSMDEFTIEMWIKPTNVMNNQKLMSKVTDNFVSGFILGIENGALDFEVFSDNQKNQLKGGTLTAGVWQHVAATFYYTGVIELFVNGELVNSMVSTIPSVAGNTNDLIIGAASWNTAAFRYSGEMDDIRFWDWDLSPEEIQEWMNIEAVQPAGRGEHQRLYRLGLYLKCDEATGDFLIDSSPEENPAGNVGIRFRKTSTVPFKGGPAFVEGLREIGGVWNGKEDYQLEKLTIEGQGLTGDQSVMIERNIATQDFCNTPKLDRVAKISCLRWHVLAQGNPDVNMTYDLSDFDLFGFKDVVLLESDEVDDFSDAKIIAGSSAGAEINTETFTIDASEKFYALGFLTQGLSVDELASANTINVYPNPSNGKFTIEVKDAKLAPQSVTVLDATGQEVLFVEFVSGSQSIDLSNQAKGVYFIRIATENGNYSKRVTIF